MAKMTLLEIVQHTVDAISGNKVNGISDTPVAERVTKIAQEVYEQEMAYGDWPHQHFIGQLTGLGDTTMPTSMKIPDAVADVDEIRYKYTDDSGNEKRPVITHIEDPREFLDLVWSRTSSDSNVEEKNVVSDDTITVLVYNDRQPEYWTSFDDEYVVFDAYDASVSTTLASANSLVTGRKDTAWSTDGAYTPDMPAHMFPYYLSRCIVVASERITEEVASSDREAAQRGRTHIRFREGKTDVKPRKKNYGRK